MTDNIITYAREYGKYGFSAKPFNEVDALLLSQLSYLNYAPFLSSDTGREKAVSVSDIYYSPERERLFDGYWYQDENAALFDAVVNSTRFGGMRLWDYRAEDSEEKELQFAAVTFRLSTDADFAAFRGTGASLVGWKEDLKLAYSRPVEAQILAAEYLNRIATQTDGRLYVGGHSKGGNLAVYAAMNAAPEIRARIDTIYDNDGPGFRPELLSTSDYDEIKGRIRKFIPRSSPVGIILEESEDYDVVDCWSVGTLQHNTYTWKSENGAFLRAKEMSDSKKAKDAALNEWILSLSEEEISTFIDTLYAALCASEAKSVFDLRADLAGSLRESKNFLKELDEDTKKALQKIVKSFIDIYGDHAAEEFSRMQKSFKDEMHTLYLGAARLLSKRGSRAE